MKNKILFLVVALVTEIVFANTSFANDDLSLKIEKLKPNVTRIFGATQVIYSTSGKFLAIQAQSKFFLLLTENLSESIDNLEKSRSWNGKIVGFLPSEMLVYSTAAATFSLNPANLKSQKIFSGKAAAAINEKALAQGEIVVLSNDLIISGDGNYDWGESKGNILKFDLKQKRFTKGAEIYAFWYASASPGGRYVLYEHGAESNNNSDLYDILRNKNYPISDYFNFKKQFPKYQTTDEAPIAWVGTNKFLAEVSENDENLEGNKQWLVLFDAAARKIVWKKQTDKSIFPSAFQQLSASKALVNYEDGVYELSLTDGKMVKSSAVHGTSIAVSPNKKRIAFFNSNQLFVDSINGGDEKSILKFPTNWKHQTAYKGMGERIALWSPDNDSLILFGENQLLFVQL